MVKVVSAYNKATKRIMDKFWTEITAVLSAIIGIAIIAVLVSNKASTTSVLNSASQGFANIVTAAVAPISGASASVNTGSSGGLTIPPVPSVSH